MLSICIASAGFSIILMPLSEFPFAYIGLVAEEGGDQLRTESPAYTIISRHINACTCTTGTLHGTVPCTHVCTQVHMIVTDAHVHFPVLLYSHSQMGSLCSPLVLGLERLFL